MQQQNQPAPQWEYQIVHLPHEAPDPATLTDQFNALGQDGWELIGAEGFYVFFKRPL